MANRKTKPTVSVMMPVYNAERYVAAAVESILVQTFSDFEIIVIDDGSTDSSFSILQEFSRCDSRVRLIRRPNAGIGKTRNEALELARGELAAILDADDIALPKRLETQVSFLRRNIDVVCVGSWFEVIDSAGRFLTELRTPETNEEIQRLLLRGHDAICQPTSMLRRSAALKVGGFSNDLSPAEDFDLHLKLGEVGLLANIPKSLGQYRLHTDSISSRDRTTMYERSQLACERAWRRRGVEGKFVPSGPVRPGDSRSDRYEWLIKFGWWAFNSNERRTAMLYGWKAILMCPHRDGGWRLLVMSIIKRPERVYSP